MKIARRTMLKNMAALAGFASISGITGAGWSHPDRDPWFKVGACDWSIHRRSEVGAMKVARKIGLDGVQISLGTIQNDMHLRQKSVQDAYKCAAGKYGVEIGGLAIGALNHVPYKSDPRAEVWVRDSIDVAVSLGVEVVLLAFFGEGDIKDDEAGRRAVIRRLKKVVPRAEDANVVLGIESWLSAEEHMEIIDSVGSPNVQVYYDVANSYKMGYDIYEEIRWLGNDHICEFHAKENGFLLGEGRIDFQRLRAVIDEIGYNGWIHIEGAVPDEGEMMSSYISNAALMRSLFPLAKHSCSS